MQNIGHARSCRRRVAAYWIEQTWRSQKCKYLIVNGFENGFHQWIQRIFLVVVDAKEIVFRKFFFFKLDPICGPVAAKPLVLELLCLEVGTSVASALTAETGFEIMKCISDVDMPARVRMGSKSEILRSKSEILRFFNSGYAHDRKM